MDSIPLQEQPQNDVSGGAEEIPLSFLHELWVAAEADSFSVSETELGQALTKAGAKNNFGLSAGTAASADQQMEFYRSLRIRELALACGCALGLEAAWNYFFQHYRAALAQAATGIAGSASIGEDLAAALYAELFGLKERDGVRVSPLAGYSGRGSLMGWLRATLAQRYVDRHRKTHRETPLEQEDFAATAAEPLPQASELTRLSHAVRGAIAGLSAEDRFLLASYFLDGRTQLELARLLRVHEATISRRLKALTKDVRTRLLKELQASGMSRQTAEELLGTDPRDLDINLRNLLQSSPPSPFFQQAGRK